MLINFRLLKNNFTKNKTIRMYHTQNMLLVVFGW